MKFLLDEDPGRKAFLLGNVAIVRGALEAGVEVATSYPGTPASEIADTFYSLSQISDVYFEYSTNEKVALEVAAGASIAGMRSLCSMKHVGLNVAADPLNTLSYTGIRSGMVIITADDPSIHSSQNEQDNRFYAKLSLLPMFEPSDPAEAKELTRTAFLLSEELGLPVLLRTTTRVNHTRGVCTYGPLIPRRFQGHFDKNPMQWVPVPAVARKLRSVLQEKQHAAYQAMQKLGIDRLDGRGDVGIITAGVAYAYVKEVLEEFGASDQVQVLKLTSIHPVPRKQIETILGSTKKVLVVEELEPYLETEVRAIANRMGILVKIFGKEEGLIPRIFELNPDRIRPAIGQFLGVKIKKSIAVELPDLPNRPPNLCAGCPHRSMYYAVKSTAEPDTYFANDIGCYTLGLLPPLLTVDSFLCMGSSITMASGVSINNPQRQVAFIGDSTFYHSGITGLVNAVHNRHDLMLVILDNSSTAMTGHQPHPGTSLDTEKQKALDMVKLVKGLGVENVQLVDPHDLKSTICAVETAYRQKGVRVIISQHPCPLFVQRVLKQRQESPVYQVNHTACKFCSRTSSHNACNIPVMLDEEILRSKTKILSKNISSLQERPLKPQTAPCTFACPANVCISGYLSLARAGKFNDALNLIRMQVSLPITLGRVCHHPCESVCVLKDYDSPVAINEVKRFVAEQEAEDKRHNYYEAVRQLSEKERKVKGSKQVAVIGSGPAGLTAAYELTVRGYQVTIFEREKSLGGLLASGIPPFRLPRHLLKTEIDCLLSVGITVKIGMSLGKDFTVKSLLEKKYAAVCIAIGAHQASHLGIEGEDCQGVEESLTFLRRVNLKSERHIGRQVLVCGGGDAAIDAARTGLRLGAESVRLVYRRSNEEMPAAPENVQAALKEGVEIQYLTVPVGFLEEGGQVTAARCIRTELGEPDQEGYRRVKPITGSGFELAADHVIIAIGQAQQRDVFKNDPELELSDIGALIVNHDTGQTSQPGIFAAGDVTDEGWSVISAVAQGKKISRSIDSFLSAGDIIKPLKLQTEKSPSESMNRYHPANIAKSPRNEPRQREPEARIKDMNEISAKYEVEQALSEANRCLSCGQCARCNNCIDNFGCPAIYVKEGLVYIDELLCNGCGVCAQLCPNNAIFPVEPRQV